MEIMGLFSLWCRRENAYFCVFLCVCPLLLKKLRSVKNSLISWWFMFRCSVHLLCVQSQGSSWYWVPHSSFQTSAFGCLVSFIRVAHEKDNPSLPPFLKNNETLLMGNLSESAYLCTTVSLSTYFLFVWRKYQICPKISKKNLHNNMI